MKKEVKKNKITKLKKINVKVPQFNPSFNYYSEHDKNFKTPKKNIFGFMRNIKSQHIYIALLLIIGISLVQIISSTYGVDYTGYATSSGEQRSLGSKYTTFSGLFSFTSLTDGLKLISLDKTTGIQRYRSSDGLIEQMRDANGIPYAETRYDEKRTKATTYILPEKQQTSGWAYDSNGKLVRLYDSNSDKVLAQDMKVSSLANGEKLEASSDSKEVSAKLSLTSNEGSTATLGGKTSVILTEVPKNQVLVSVLPSGLDTSSISSGSSADSIVSRLYPSGIPEPYTSGYESVIEAKMNDFFGKDSAASVAGEGIGQAITMVFGIVLKGFLWPIMKLLQNDVTRSLFVRFCFFIILFALFNLGLSRVPPFAAPAGSGHGSNVYYLISGVLALIGAVFMPQNFIDLFGPIFPYILLIILILYLCYLIIRWGWNSVHAARGGGPAAI